MDRKDSGILAGILGASCCVLPLILVAGGLGCMEIMCSS